MDKDEEMKADVLMYLGVHPYNTPGNISQGDATFLRMIEQRYNKTLDEMLTDLGIDMSWMSDVARIKANMIVKCTSCGATLRINNIETHPPSPALYVHVAPCGSCIKRAVSREEKS